MAGQISTYATESDHYWRYGMVRQNRYKIVTDDFRIYEPETFVDENGLWIVMRKCEELINGRWEPFYIAEKGRLQSSSKSCSSIKR